MTSLDWETDRLRQDYLLPVIPLMILWDGLVSPLRTYSPDELRELVVHFDGYDWQIDSVPAGKGPQRITYLIGEPHRS